MKIYLNILLLTSFLCGCAAFGTKTLYKTSEKTTIRNFGFTELSIDSLHGVIPKKYSNTKNVFNETIMASFKEKGFDSLRFSNHFFSFSNPDTTKIRELCSIQNIDGIILSQLRFGSYQSGTGAIGYVVSSLTALDTEVAMKLYDKSGKLLISTSHDTNMGNSYFWFPSQDTMVEDGTEGAVRRLIAELTSLSK